MTSLVPLDVSETTRLAHCEATVRSGLQTFVQVGRALAEIRDARLYRQTHTSFEAYCDMEFGLSRSRAYQMIDAAGIAHAVSTIVDTPAPATESQARELSGLTGEEAAAVMRTAAEAEQRVTAAGIARAREHVAPKPPAPVKLTETHTEKTETWADTTTGEVLPVSVGAPTVRPEPDVEKHFDDPEGMATANYLARLAKAIKVAGDLTSFSAAEVAAKAEPQQIVALDDLVESLNDFLSAVRKQRGNVLRLVDTR